MEEIGLKSTHKIRALELFSGDLFFTFLETSLHSGEKSIKSLVFAMIKIDYLGETSIGVLKLG